MKSLTFSILVTTAFCAQAFGTNTALNDAPNCVKEAMSAIESARLFDRQGRLLTKKNPNTALCEVQSVESLRFHPNTYRVQTQCADLTDSIYNLSHLTEERTQCPSGTVAATFSVMAKDNYRLDAFSRTHFEVECGRNDSSGKLQVFKVCSPNITIASTQLNNSPAAVLFERSIEDIALSNPNKMVYDNLNVYHDAAQSLSKDLNAIKLNSRRIVDLAIKGDFSLYHRFKVAVILDVLKSNSQARIEITKVFQEIAASDSFQYLDDPVKVLLFDGLAMNCMTAYGWWTEFSYHSFCTNSVLPTLHKVAGVLAQKHREDANQILAILSRRQQWQVARMFRDGLIEKTANDIVDPYSLFVARMGNVWDFPFLVADLKSQISASISGSR